MPEGKGRIVSDVIARIEAKLVEKADALVKVKAERARGGLQEVQWTHQKLLWGNRNTWICGFENGATSGEAKSKCATGMGRHGGVMGVGNREYAFQVDVLVTTRRARLRESQKSKPSVSWVAMVGGSTQWSQAWRAAAQPNGLSTEDARDGEQWCGRTNREQAGHSPLLDPEVCPA